MFPIYGIAATDATDRTGERLNIAGADISDLRIFNDEHKSSNFFSILGDITRAKKILKEEECEDEKQLKCWNLVKRPLIYVEGNIIDDGHPNAEAATALIKYSLTHPNFPVGLSVEGATIARNGNNLDRSKIIAASLTIKPCNTQTRIFPVNNLMKSWEVFEIPEIYKNTFGRKQFRELPSEEMRLLNKSILIKEVNTLIKSGNPSDEGATIMRCWNCGEARLLMKSRLPNRCIACHEGFSMRDIFRAKVSEPIV